MSARAQRDCKDERIGISLQFTLSHEKIFQQGCQDGPVTCRIHVAGSFRSYFLNFSHPQLVIKEVP